MNDNNLSSFINDFRNGGNESFKEIYKLYYSAIHAFVNRIVENQQDAYDIATDTFTKLWDRRAGFKSLMNIKKFLYTVARHAAIDYLRMAGRNRRLLESLLLLDLKNDQSITEEVIHPELIPFIYDAIEHLPRQCRNVTKSIFMEGYTIRETAERLNMHLENVRFQKSRGRKQLRELIIAWLKNH